MKLTLILFCLVLSSQPHAQTIKGSLCFENEPHSFMWIGISTSLQKMQCDSLGQFQLNYAANSDVLEVFPFPGAFYKVRIINLPKTIDTLTLEAIPIYRNTGHGIPIINFKNKRSSKKYFKKLEAEQRAEEKELEVFINERSYFWNGKEYPLRLERTKESGTIYIDLKE